MAKSNKIIKTAFEDSFCTLIHTCGYSLEMLRVASDQYPQCMISGRNKQNVFLIPPLTPHHLVLWYVWYDICIFLVLALVLVT